MLSRDEIVLRIKIARDHANLSARALSLKADLNAGYINRLETGKDFLPSLEALLRIIEACNMTEEQFFYHDINKFKDDMALINSFKDVSDEKKTAVAVLLKN